MSLFFILGKGFIMGFRFQICMALDQIFTFFYKIMCCLDVGIITKQYVIHRDEVMVFRLSSSLAHTRWSSRFYYLNITLVVQKV